MHSNKVGISAENVDAPVSSVGNAGGIHTENNDQSSVYSKNNSD